MKTNQPNLEMLQTQIGPQRLVELCDGSLGVRGGMAVKIEQPADANGQPIVDFVASDETLDRYDEVVTAAGWKLDNYKRNPVFQNSHKYGDVIFTLGKSILTEVRGKSLFQRILFAVEINPVAKLAYDLYRSKFLNAVSVGFIPLRWENGAESAEYRRRYIEQELLELSAVSVPANPNALAAACKAGAVDKSDLKELADFLKQFCSDNAGAENNSSEQVSRANGSQLLQIARDVRAVLRHA